MDAVPWYCLLQHGLRWRHFTRILGLLNYPQRRGTRPNIYEVVVYQQAVVEVRFRVKARLQVKVQGYLAENLLQCIQALRQRDAQWAEMLQVLNPKNDPEIQAFLVKLRELNPSSELDTIESVCRENEKANWQTVIKEAHRQASIARARELRERKVKLRGLDIAIAETFVFYISIDWNARSYMEPT